MAKVEIEVSDKNEATRAPYWVIVEPMNIKDERLEDGGAISVSWEEIASRVTGLFFSREEAESYLKLTHYNFAPGAVVYCKSGYRGRQYDEACDEAKIGHFMPGQKAGLIDKMKKGTDATQ